MAKYLSLILDITDINQIMHNRSLYKSKWRMMKLCCLQVFEAVYLRKFKTFIILVIN